MHHRALVSRADDRYRSGTILYYALGGGLGHLTRTLAILKHLEQPADTIRILASSPWTHLVRPCTLFSIDRVPEYCMRSRNAYGQFLEDYIRKYAVWKIVLDTFPFGIVGEWQGRFPEIPRFLIARALKWQDYIKRINSKNGILTDENLVETLVIEPQDPAYEDFLNRKSRMTYLDEPIVYDGDGLKDNDPDQQPAWLVIHSGDRSEQQALLWFARDQRKQMGHEDTLLCTVFPDQGIFPASKIMGDYSHIVSAAGYNMTAIARQANGVRRHFLVPFYRRFDDQHKRAGRFEKRYRPSTPDSCIGAQKAAAWLKSFIF